MFAASKTSTPSVSGPDPQFNYVTMLLHGDGTNGAQNNTFLDSSTNNFTITRNGNTTQGSFSPYGPVGNWSTFFDGTQDNLYTASTTALNVGSGNFTFECFFNVSVFNGGNILRGANQYSACALLLNGTGVIYYISSNGASWDIASGQTAISSGLIAGFWYHLALVRNGNVVTPYVNGVAGTTTTTSATFSALNGFNIGAEQNGVAGGSFNGFISNVRVVVGTAVYTSNFTPPTANLTAISGTQLLACQNSQFKDNSSNNFAFTTAGTPSVQRFNPFGTATAYSTSVIGGSGYFDGSGDYLETPSIGQFAPSGDFTVSFWYYPTSNKAYQQVIGNYNGGSSTTWIVEITSGYGVTFYTNGVTPRISGSGIFLNAWNYLVMARSGSTITGYVNGVSIGTYSQSGTLGSASLPISVGRGGSSSAPSDYTSGYVADVKLIDGSSITTIPTAPQTLTSGTNLLLKMTNGAIFDNAMMNDLETVGNAQISTSVVKYGTGSIALDGTGDYLRPNAQLPFAFDTGNFTIEFWVYPNSVSGYLTFYDGRYPAVSQGFVLFYNAGFNYYTQAGSLISGGTLSASTWTHVALCRASGSVRLFVNGTQVGSTATDTTNYSIASVQPNGPFIGSNYVPADYLNGYLDEFRVTKGYARYTANFTPPTAAFSNTGPL